MPHNRSLVITFHYCTQRSNELKFLYFYNIVLILLTLRLAKLLEPVKMLGGGENFFTDIFFLNIRELKELSYIAGGKEEKDQTSSSSTSGESSSPNK